MPSTIENIDEYWAGDTLHLVFEVYDDDAAEPDARKDLEGADIDWWLARSGERALDGSDSDVAVEVIDDAGGLLQIRISAAATEDFGSHVYDERLRIIDSNGRRSTFAADFEVLDPNW